jgi:Cu(I)/Ag(I) efflux system membrane fusion protein
MNKRLKRWTIIAFLIVVVGTASLLALRSMNNQPPPPGESAMATSSMNQGRTMKSVVISPTQLQTLGVRLDTLEVRPLHKVIRTVGWIDYDERRLTTVSTKVSGWIEKLYVNYTGEFVDRDAPLYEIYSPEVVSAEEEYLLALGGHIKTTEQPPSRWERDEETLLESAERRLQFWDVPNDHIRDLTETRKITKTMMIHSPASGFILKKDLLQGSYVKTGDELFTIADISDVWLYADIYEYELPLVAVGQTAELSLAYFPGETFEGTITYIYPYLEEKTRTVKIRFEFPNPDGRLKPGMFADVRLDVPITDHGLALPDEAVLDTGERQIVFVRKSEGVFDPREVTLGPKAEGYYLVIEGVEQGDIVAGSANFLIDSESRLGSAMMKMKM